MIYKVRTALLTESFSSSHCSSFLIVAMENFGIAGFWALLYADIHWDLLPRSFTPKLHDTSTSIDPTVNNLTGNKKMPLR